LAFLTPKFKHKSTDRDRSIKHTKPTDAEDIFLQLYRKEKCNYVSKRYFSVEKETALDVHI
jgi:hypothetical protein